MKNNLSFLLFTTLYIYVAMISCKNGNSNKEKSIFKYNEASGIATLDPAFASGQSTIWACHQIFNGLVELDDSLKIIPAIAKSWNISEDGKIYTFILRNDVIFQNTPFFSFEKLRVVTASDFVYSFNRILDKKIASPGVWIFQNVKRDNNGIAAFKAVNDTTLQIELSKPFSPFLGILTMTYCSVLPKEAVNMLEDNFRKAPVGTGPFQIHLWKEGVKLVLRKNPLYFEKDSDGTKLPYLDAIAITFIAEKQSAFMEFMKGNLDLLSGIDPSYKDALLDNMGMLKPEFKDEIVMLKSSYLNTEYLAFNLNYDKSSPYNIKEVRQAINYGFDRKKMIRFLRNNVGIPGTAGFIPKGMPGFNHLNNYGYDYNHKKALELLAKAGYPNGKKLPPVKLSLSASYLDLCQYIQHELEKIGIKIELDVQQPAQQREMMRNYRLQFFRASWICDYPDPENYLSLFYSKNVQPTGSNYSHYVNSDFDKKIDQALSVNDNNLRTKYYTQLDSIVMDDAPVIILFYDEAIRFTHKNIKNLTINPINLLSLKKNKKN